MKKPIVRFFCALAAFSSSLASGGTWTQIGVNDDHVGAEVFHSVLYLELPIIRSTDGTVVVAHYRTDFTPGLKGLTPNDETKSVENIGTFDCTTHEHWISYAIGMPFPGHRNTLSGSGSRRQIIISNFITDADVDWSGATVGAYLCGKQPR